MGLKGGPKERIVSRGVFEKDGLSPVKELPCHRLREGKERECECIEHIEDGMLTGSFCSVHKNTYIHVEGCVSDECESGQIERKEKNCWTLRITVFQNPKTSRSSLVLEKWEII